jgi:heme oxygenase (biliverdin-IX-beta and delta-forming)
MTETYKRSHGYTTSSSNEPQFPEPSYAERVRTLVYRSNVGTLSTMSEKHPGSPFGSLMPYGLDAKGRVVFLISTMAMHTHNLIQDPKASLFVSQTDSGGDPLDASRVTLMGQVTKVPDDETKNVRELYLSRYGNASYWVDFDDFSFYRMDITDIYFVGGFGAMGWVTSEEYTQAEADPLSDSASGIIQHMNEDHADALILMVKKFLGMNAEEASMTSVDRLGFQVRIKSDGEFYSRRVGFLKEVRTPEQAREALVEMVKTARSGNGD